MNIGGYEVGQVFHIGSSGPMWRTRTEDGDALLALRSSREGERCLARWKAWASVNSRHVVALRDVVRSDDGRWAIVEDYVVGRTLDTELGSPDLRPIATRRQIIQGVAAGLSALHSAGIAHGDLTPANIMITPEGRAVIIDLIDEIGEGQGTPGWSLDSSGTDVDRQCLARIATLLNMDEELTHLGVADSSVSDAGDTRTVGEPDEHVIVREPVDPERVIAQLRAAALREDTQIDAASTSLAVPTSTRRRHASGRVAGARLRTLSVLAAGVIAIVAGVSIVAYGLREATPSVTAESTPEQAASVQSSAQSVAACDASSLSATINRAIRTRDEAVMNGDASALDAVLGGELLEQDRARIASMQAEGVRVTELSSHVGNVSVLSCEPGAIEVGATLTLQSSQTCRSSGCETRDTPTATELVIRIDPVSGKVVKAQPVESGTGQSGLGPGNAG